MTLPEAEDTYIVVYNGPNKQPRSVLKLTDGIWRDVKNNLYYMKPADIIYFGFEVIE